MSQSALNVLVPTTSVTSSPALLEVAEAVVNEYGGQGTLLSVVEVPEERSLSEAALVVRRRRGLLRKLKQLPHARDFTAEVVTAHSLESGVRLGVGESRADLLLLNWRLPRSSGGGSTLEQLTGDPPCDLAAVKAGNRSGVRRVLVPARGGPHARLALRLAEAVARQHGAVLTLFHVTLPGWSEERRRAEREYFSAVRDEVRYDKVEDLQIEADSVERALIEYGAVYDVVVMGAVARDERSSYLFGAIPEMAARQLDATVVVVKTKEPVTAGTFGLVAEPVIPAEHRNISELVDRWFAQNTFHSHEFRNIRYLLDLKERQGKTISLALPTLNEEKTVGKIITTIQRNLIERYPLLDELIVIDSNSTDSTVSIAESLGVPVFKHPEILPGEGSFTGKGEALWKSLYVTRGDIVVWIDSDISGLHPKFVYGLVGPLLTDMDVGFVKGFYRRPLNLGGKLMTTGGGRVTELTARPLINLFFPELSGLVQPLAGEMAGRREVLENVPFFTGYGVETGLLIDILERFGLDAIAQADLETRVHRNQSLLSLSKMAFAIIQVVIERRGQNGGTALMDEMNRSMKLIHYSPTELFLEVKEIRENERPPIVTLPDYQRRFAPAIREPVSVR
jgi:glucosyl-3-phosphoglycerate synthase